MINAKTTALYAARGEIPQAIAQAIIDTTSPSDDSNVRRAAHAFLAFWPSYDDETFETGIADLLCDLKHLCDLAGVDFYAKSHGAHGTYSEEVAECGGVARHEALSHALKSFLS